MARMGPTAVPSVLLLLLALAFVWKIMTSIYNASRNPLNKIPGPWYARFTNLRLKLAVITGRRMFYVDSMHRLYGPIVRVSPTEIAVSDPAAFQAIHKIGSGFNKTNWYEDLVAFERPTLFTMTDSKAHAARRKLLARGFSKSYLRGTWEGLVRSKIELTVKKMKEEGSGGAAVDVLKWWTLLATDVSSHLMFGQSFEMIEKGKTDMYIQTLQATLQGAGIGVELPLVRRIGSWIPTDTCKQFFRSTPFLMEYGTKAIRGSKDRGDSANIFAKIISESEKGAVLDERDVVLEATALIVAGSDTTGVSLTYLVWAVLSRPLLRNALEEELSSIPDNYGEQELEELPLLNAVIDETLRLYGAAPGGLPRAAPAEGVNLAGYFIPGGTIVTTQAYTIHRSDELFAHAADFDPSRWFGINSEKASSQEALAKVAYHPFGAGSRVCLGIHLARMELRLAAAEFFRQCKRAELAPSTTAESMEMENFFLITPRSHRCDIVFT